MEAVLNNIPLFLDGLWTTIRLTILAGLIALVLGLFVALLRVSAFKPLRTIGTCYVEFGGGMVGMVEANFFGGPNPTARLVGPSRELAADKAAFALTRRERWFGSGSAQPPDAV